MANKVFKALVIDDEQSRNSTYHSVLDEKFQTDIINDVSEVTRKKVKEYDLVLLDVCLSKNNNNLTAFKIIEDHRITVPTVLVSGEWVKDDGEPNEDILQVPKYKNIIKLISWNDFNKGENNLKIAEEIYYDFCKERNISNVNSEDSCIILHLSDLQFGGNEAGAACNDNIRLATFLKQNKCIPDIILITGDIADKGRKEEYSEAKQWIEKLMKTVWDIEGDLVYDDRQKLILVPGNHDYDISINASDEYSFQFKQKDIDSFVKKDATKVSFEHQKLGFSNFINFAKRLTLDESWDDLICHVIRTNQRFYNLGINFLLFNSVYNINCRNCENRHDEFYCDLSKIDSDSLSVSPVLSDNTINVLVMHNTPNDFHRETSNGEKSKNIFQTLIEDNHISMCFYGHSHDDILPRQFNDNGGEWSENMICISAPTYRLAAASRTEDAYRGFNIVELKKNGGNSFKKAIVKNYELKKAEIILGRTKEFDLK